MISWGMIGTGDVTEKKSGPAFYKAASSRLYCVCNRTHAKAQDYAKRHNIEVVHESVEALLADPGVDCVYVATPPSTHREIALQVIAAGKPLCLEKPMALNADECWEIIEAAEQKQVPVYVTYYRRSQEKFLTIKKMLNEGVIGKVGTIKVTQYQELPQEVKNGNIPWRFKQDIAGGGILVDMGSHVFDIIDFIFGPITDIHGHVANFGGHYDVEDMASVSFMVGNDICGSALFNFNTLAWEDKIEVSGEKGKLIFSVFDNEPVELHTEGSTESLPFAPPDPVYLPFVEDMTTLIEQGDKKGYSHSAIRTTILLDRLLATYTQSNR